MKRFVDLVLAHPRAVLLIILVGSAALWPITSKLRLDTDIVDLFPMGNSEAQAFARFSRAFTSEQALLVLAVGDDPAELQHFADQLGAQMSGQPDVSEVRFKLTSGAGRFLRDHLLSLLNEAELQKLAARAEPAALTERVHRLRSILQAPGGSALATTLVADPLEALSVAQDRLSSGLPVNPHSGYFQSSDGKAILVYVRPRASAFDVNADRRLLASASSAAEKLGARVIDDFSGSSTGIRVGFTGVCAFTVSYRDWLHTDMQASTIFSAASILILFFVFFRSFLILPLVSLPLGLGLWWTATAAHLCFGRVNAVSLAFGTILLSIGVDLPIQLYNRLREELAKNPESPRAALALTLHDLAGPSVVATVGPAVVFFSCAASSYRGLAELGFLAGLGLLLNLVAMLTVFPAMLLMLPERWWGRVRATPARGAITGFIGELAARRPRLILLVVAIVGVAALPLAAHLRVEKRLISIQPPAMPPARVQRELEQRFGGHERLLIGLTEDADPERALERSDAWMVEAEQLRRQGLLAGYESISALFPSEKTGAARRATLTAAGAAGMADRLEKALSEAGFDVAPFAPFINQLRSPPPPPSLHEPGSADLSFLVQAHVHDDAAGRHIATFLYPAPGEAGIKAIAALREFARGQGDVVTGSPILEEVLGNIVTRDTRVISLVSTVCVALLLALYYRRWRPYVAVMGPLVLAWLLFAAALAAIKLPLNLFNLLCIPLVIGYGIDDHVYLVHRHRQHPGSPAETLRTTGRAIVLTSLSTMAGFAALIVARFDGLRSLGIAGALAVAFCLIAAFAILPALLALLWPAPPKP